MRTRWLPVLALAVLAPVCAEYLWAYDSSTGHPAVLVGSLLVFTPLYGCPALLIREVARRRGLGWPSVVLLAAAFGTAQAGLVDQSMFARSYHDIPYWSAMADPTYVAPIGLSVFLAVTFVANHVLASICGPIALVEAFGGSGPWLSRTTVVVAALLYAGASALVLGDALTSGQDTASAGQLAGAAAAAALLVAAALRGVPPAGRGTARPPAAPDPWLLVPAAAVTFGGAVLLPPSPLGTDALLALYAAAGTAIWWLAGRAGWSPAHVAALATGWLTAFAVGAFATEPIGSVTRAEALGHHVALLALVALTGVAAVARARVAWRA